MKCFYFCWYLNSYCQRIKFPKSVIGTRFFYWNDTRIELIYTGLLTHVCVTDLWVTVDAYWLVPCSAPSHYLNQCGLTVNWILRNKFFVKFGLKYKQLSFQKMHSKMFYANWRPFCSGVILLIVFWQVEDDWLYIDDEVLTHWPLGDLNGILYKLIIRYRKTSSISRTKSPNLNVSRLVLWLSSPNPLKPGAK